MKYLSTEFYVHRTRSKNAKNLRLEPYIYIFIDKFILALWASMQKFLFKATSKKYVLGCFYIHFDRPIQILKNFCFLRCLKTVFVMFEKLLFYAH
jgi:hypothetical protein